jgi:hypothetical protein
MPPTAEASNMTCSIGIAVLAAISVFVALGGETLPPR